MDEKLRYGHGIIVGGTARHCRDPDGENVGAEYCWKYTMYDER